MGINKLLKKLESYKSKIHLSKYSNKKVGIDIL